MTCASFYAPRSERAERVGTVASNKVRRHDGILRGACRRATFDPQSVGEGEQGDGMVGDKSRRCDW